MLKRAWAPGLIGMVVGMTMGCSSSPSGSKYDGEGNGGSGGAGGAGGQAGGSPSDGGPVDAPGFDVPVDPGTPLCPTSGRIMSGTTASPLPDDVEVVSPLNLPRFLVLNDTAAFWSDKTTIHRIDLGTGTDTVILDRSNVGLFDTNSMQGLALDGDTIYFGEAGITQAYGVAKMPAAGGTPTTIVAGNSMWQVTVSGGFIYYYDAGQLQIGRAPVGGGTPTILVRDVNPGQLLVVGGYLYFVHPITSSLEANVLRVPVTAQAPTGSTDGGIVPLGTEVVAPGDHYASNGIAADSTALYFDDDNRVMKVALAGGAATTLYTAPDHPGNFGLTDTTRVGAVLPANGKLYWDLELGPCSDIMWSSTDGTGVGSRVHGVSSPGALFANATHLYFVSANWQLLRIPL